MFDALPMPAARPAQTQKGAACADHRTAWAAAALRAIRAETAASTPPEPQWTPDAAGKALIEALRWLRHAGGRVGPAGMVSARLPEAVLSLDDFAAAGWGLPETADDPNDAPPLRVQLTGAQVTRHLAALEWPARYLAEHEGSRCMVALWARCKAHRRPFNEAVKARGTIHRAMAYRLRDRGLSMIAQGLDRDRVPLA